MIIYYKLPGYPTASATLPFAKISAMRKKQLEKYYNNCIGGKNYSIKHSPGGLRTLAKQKTVEGFHEIDDTSKKALQRSSDIKKLMKEVTGHYCVLRRRVHSNGEGRECFLLKHESEDDSVVNKMGKCAQRKVDNNDDEKLATNTKLTNLFRCPIYITYV